MEDQDVPSEIYPLALTDGSHRIARSSHDHHRKLPVDWMLALSFFRAGVQQTWPGLTDFWIITREAAGICPPRLSDGSTFNSLEEDGQQNAREWEDECPCQDPEAHLQRAEHLVGRPDLVGQHVADPAGDAEDPVGDEQPSNPVRQRSFGEDRCHKQGGQYQEEAPAQHLKREGDRVQVIEVEQRQRVGLLRQHRQLEEAVDEREHLGLEAASHRRGAHPAHHSAEVPLPLDQADHCDRSTPDGDRGLPDDAQADTEHQRRAERGDVPIAEPAEARAG